MGLVNINKVWTMKELWNAASEEEQQAIASSMVRLVQNAGK